MDLPKTSVSRISTNGLWTSWVDRTVASHLQQDIRSCSRVGARWPDGRINYRAPIARNSRKTSYPIREQVRCIFIGVGVHRGAIGNGSVERRKYTACCKHRNYLTFILSLARWPGSNSSSRLDIVEYSPCCSYICSESGFTWKNHRFVAQRFFPRRIVLKSNFPFAASGEECRGVPRTYRSVVITSPEYE